MCEIPYLRQIRKSADGFHQAVSKPWLGPAKMTVTLLFAATLAVVIATFANSLVRAKQLESWQLNKESSFIDGAPSFSTADAPYFLLNARLIENGLSTRERDNIRAFPNWSEPDEEVEQETSFLDWPLISVTLSAS